MLKYFQKVPFVYHSIRKLKDFSIQQWWFPFKSFLKIGIFWKWKACNMHIPKGCFFKRYHDISTTSFIYRKNQMAKIEGIDVYIKWPVPSEVMTLCWVLTHSVPKCINNCRVRDFTRRFRVRTTHCEYAWHANWRRHVDDARMTIYLFKHLRSCKCAKPSSARCALVCSTYPRREFA